MKQNQHNNKWLDEIRDEMQDFSADIPADGWERVACDLPSSARNRWWGAAAVSLLCALLGGSYYLFAPQPEDFASLPEDVSSLPEAATVISQPQQQMQINDAVAPTTAKSFMAKMTRNQSLTDSSAADSVPCPKTSAEAPQPLVQEESAASFDTLQYLLTDDTEALLALNKFGRKTHSDARWSLGLHLGGNGSLLAMNAGDKDYQYNGPGPGTDTGINTPVLPDEILDSSHHASWSFGLALGRQVLPHTTFETGLVYTLLTSDVQIRHKGTQEQQIHYLGVPLTLNYHWLEEEPCQLYIGGGVMLERALRATRGGERIPTKPWQWSANLSLGAEFRLSEHMRLYLEPGISYYFDADASTPTLRSASPSYFNLRGGIRLVY